MDIEELVKEIVDAAFQVKKRLVPGFFRVDIRKGIDNRVDRERIRG